MRRSVGQVCKEWFLGLIPTFIQETNQPVRKVLCRVETFLRDIRDLSVRDLVSTLDVDWRGHGRSDWHVKIQERFVKV